MYLSARKYVSNSLEKDVVESVVKLFPEIGNFEDLQGVTINFGVGYWRKENHIHHWFVENVQDGSDDCKEYYVSAEQLKELKALCEEVKTNHSLANDKLPTQGGFFFGSTDYDEWYFKSLDYTIDVIDKCLELSKIDKMFGYDFEYSSSW